MAAFLACVATRNGDPSSLAPEIKDPMRPELSSLAASAVSPRALVDAVFDQTDILPKPLTWITVFRHRVADLLEVLEQHGVEAAVMEATR